MKENDNRFWALALTMDTSPINIFCPRRKHHNKEKLQIKDYFSSLRQCFTHKEVDLLFWKFLAGPIVGDLFTLQQCWSPYLFFPAVFKSLCLLGLLFRFYWLSSLVPVYRRLLIKDDIENALTEKVHCLRRIRLLWNKLACG